MIPFTLMLLAHALGDYYLQPAYLAKLKSKSTWYVLIHTSIYAAMMFATVCLYNNPAYFIAICISVVTHAAIDIIKQLILNSRAKAGILTVKEDRSFYLIDQVLHMSIIFACSLFASSSSSLGQIDFLSRIIPSLIGIDGYTLLSYITALIAVMKPTNIFIQKILITEKPTQETTTRLRFGGRIGTLERIVTIVMLALGQYAAIALVFTAKSIVRFKDFENRSFAEYYLYGTLLSVVTSLSVFALLKLFGA